MLRAHSVGTSVASVLAAALLSACHEGPPVTVGAALSVTFVEATRLALSDAIAEGGLPPIDTVLVSESTNRAAPALEIATTLAARSGMVGVVAHSNSSASLAASPIYNQAGIVQIAPTSTTGAYTGAGEFSFRLAPADHLQGELLVDAIDSLFPAGARIALLFVNDDYGTGLRASVLERLDRTLHPVVFDQPHADVEPNADSTATEHHAAGVIAQVAAASPDLVVWLGRTATLRPYLRELRRQVGLVPLLGGDALSSYSADDLSSGLFTGVRYADYLNLEASPELLAFKRRFDARQLQDARTAEVLSYDAMRLLLGAIRDGARSGREVRDWLLTLGRERPPWPGISGPISFTEDGDINRGYVLIAFPDPPPAP